MKPLPLLYPQVHAQIQLHKKFCPSYQKKFPLGLRIDPSNKLWCVAVFASQVDICQQEANLLLQIQYGI